MIPSSSPHYAELHARTNFSFLRGASHPDELVGRAAELGLHALAVTDRHSLAGVVRAHVAAQQAGLKLIVGAEILPADGPPMVLWAMDRAGYGRLSRLITLGARRAEKGECLLRVQDIAQHAGGLIAGVILRSIEEAESQKPEPWDSAPWEKAESRRPKAESGRPKAESERKAKSGRKTESGPRKAASDGKPPFSAGGSAPAGRRGQAAGTVIPTMGAESPKPKGVSKPASSKQAASSLVWQRTLDRLPQIALLRDIFGDRCYLLAELHLGPDDRAYLAAFKELSRRSGVPLAAAGGVDYHVPQRKRLHDVLVAIRLGCTVAEAEQAGLLAPNAQGHLKSPAQMAALFADCPEAVARTVEIADRCRFSLDQLRYEYPEELAPPDMTPMQYLRQLTWQGAERRYPGGVPEKVRRLLEHELELIEQLHYEAYFLTVWDLVQFARSRGILCQGRGSAANSAVCYVLGITAVDPDRMDLLFERFISRERNEAPDIDVDFEHERREEVIQYIYRKYGRDRAGMTAEVITYRSRSAVREVGKALGLSLDRVDALARRIEHFHAEPDLPARCREAGIDPESELGRQLVELVGQLAGFPRHLSQHTGGMVITRGPLCELVPIENAAMPERTVIQWNKDDLDELGVLKVDCLALGMLTAVRKCFELIERHHGRRLSLAEIPEGDQSVYAMIRRADTIGVFQIESRAQMSMLPRLKPRCFYDLVIEVAIVRPGPIQGQMVHPYLRRRNGQEAVTYPNEQVRQVLGKTLGVPLFQEQAMRLAMVAAGFTPGEADQLRRAMGAWRRPGLIDQFRRRLVEGMLSRGFSRRYAEAVFRQIRGFGDYGFPESHAASFALLVYVSAWLKCHYQAAFTCALLNSQPMGFYAPAQLVRDARDHGVPVLPVDVNFSHWDCTLEHLDPSCSPRAGEDGKRTEPGGSTRRRAAVSQSGPGSVPAAHTPGFSPASGRQDRAALTSGRFAKGPGELRGADAAGCWAVRLGFRMVRGIGRAHVEQLVRARADRPFAGMEDLARRTRLPRSVLDRLSQAGAFGSLGLDRRRALWESLVQQSEPLPLFEIASRRAAHEEPAAGSNESERGKEDALTPGTAAATQPEKVREAAPAGASSASARREGLLPALSPAQEVLADYRTLGLSLRAHPLSFLRGQLQKRGVVPAERLSEWKNGQPVTVAGIVLLRQRPATAKGITFLALEDETGIVNLLVRPAVWQRYRRAALSAVVLLAQGRLQRAEGVTHVVVGRLEDLSGWLSELKDLEVKSRDFC